MKKKLPVVSDFDVEGKNVLVRADLDGGTESQRFRVTEQIVEYLKRNGAKRIKVIGHKGDISMAAKLGVDINWDLRADGREEADKESLAEELALGFEVYVNEAFATSHRRHCSVDALPRLMKKQGKEVAVGLRFEKEIEMLVQTMKKSGKKVLVIGGAKAGDKAKYADEFEKRGWEVLRGGLLPGASLRADGKDISDEEIERFKIEIEKAGVVVLAGPMGKYEEVEKGTREVFTAVANSGAYKIAGGGDTEAALQKFGLTGKFDWISVGGGAMLEFLATGTLPGIEVLC